MATLFLCFRINNNNTGTILENICNTQVEYKIFLNNFFNPNTIHLIIFLVEMSPQYHQINRKIVVLGSIKSGKSSLVSRFVDRDTSPNMIEKNIYITIKRNDQEIKLQILDTFQCNSKHMSHQASLGAHGYILCFSLASRTQFATIKLINK